MISAQFARLLFSFMFFGAFTDLQTAIFSTLPGPLSSLYNKTLIKHYSMELSPTALSSIPTIISISTAIGMLSSLAWILPLMDTYGRKFVAINLRCTLGVVSCSLQAIGGWLDIAELFVVGQLFLGLSIPIKLMVVAVFVTECAPDNRRGFASLTLHVGDILASLLIYWMVSPTVLGSNTTWPIVPVIALILCLLLYISTTGIHDSPKWLVQNGQHELALKGIEFYSGSNENCDRILTSLCIESNFIAEKNMSFKSAWRDDTVRQAIIVITVLQLMITCSPLLLEKSYTVVIHTSLGLTVDQSLVLCWTSTLLLAPLGFLSMFAIDKIGRRPIVFIAAGIIYLKILVMFAAQLLVFLNPPSWITLVMTVTNELGSGLVSCTGATSTATILVSELVPPAARVPVAQALLIVSLLPTTLIMVLFPLMNALFPPAIYAAMLILQPLIVIFLIRNLPETKQRPVHEIVCSFEEDLRSSVSVRRIEQRHQKSWSKLFLSVLTASSWVMGVLGVEMRCADEGLIPQQDRPS